MSAQKLKDKAYTDVHGITNSVMDYTANNIPLKGEAPTTLVNSTLGAYDYWAIEYAYKPLPQDQEAAELARIAARSTEPELAYGDDVDQGIGGAYDGFDRGPTSSTWATTPWPLPRSVSSSARAVGAPADAQTLPARTRCAPGARWIRPSANWLAPRRR